MRPPLDQKTPKLFCRKAFEKISILTVSSTSEQRPLCSDVFLYLRQKRRHLPAPLLLLSESQPLCWVVIWFRVQTWKLWHPSIMLRYSKKKDTLWRVFLFGFRRQKAAPPFGFKYSGEVNSPCAKVLGRWPKTLVRRKRAAGRLAGLVNL